MRVADEGTRSLPATWESQQPLNTSWPPAYTSTSQCCTAMGRKQHRISGEQRVELPQSCTALDLLEISYKEEHSPSFMTERVATEVSRW